MTEISFIYPEVLVAVMSCVILLVHVFFGRGAFVLSLLTLLGAALITVAKLPLISTVVFDGAFIVDRFGSILKLALYLLLALTFIYSRIYIQTRNFFHGEFFVLSLLSMLGMMVLISSLSFLTMYLGLELLVLPLYAMIVMAKNDSRYPEAAMKYFIIGALGAGILLYGISFIYGATGTFAFAGVNEVHSAPFTLQLGMVFVIVGLALEFGAAPFHMWLPDVYEGSPTAVTMIVGTLPKIAVFAVVYRLLTVSFIELSAEWTKIFMLLAMLSIVLGNMLAIAQQNIKRMLAYSTIAHIGFILLGLFAAQQTGYVAVIYYTLVYVFMSLAAFAVILRLTAKGMEADKISDFNGLAKTEPWLSFVMLLVMFSLAGIPPLLGFYPKFLILQNVVDTGHPFIAAIALLFSVIGTFYYLRVIKTMYFADKSDDIKPIPVKGMSRSGTMILSIHGLLLLVFGLFPAVILTLCVNMLR